MPQDRLIILLCFLRSFTHLKIDPTLPVVGGSGGSDYDHHDDESDDRYSKRSMTVEGSPMHFKRLDTSKTPHFDRSSFRSFPQPDSIVPQLLSAGSAGAGGGATSGVIHLRPVDEARREEGSSSAAGIEAAEILSSRLPIEESAKVLVIVAVGSEAHDTNEHQENAERMELLVNPDRGCLFR